MITFSVDGKIPEEIKKFKKKYFDLVEKAQKIMPKDKSKRKTLHFWHVGKLLYGFNKSIENQFKITNYDTALMRDFEFFKSPRIIFYCSKIWIYSYDNFRFNYIFIS